MSGKSDVRWGVFVRDPADGPEWTERHRWIGRNLDALTSQPAADARAAETAALHPDWDVEARQTADPLPGTFTETFRELLPHLSDDDSEAEAAASGQIAQFREVPEGSQP
jgi:hypothetical protein